MNSELLRLIAVVIIFNIVNILLFIIAKIMGVYNQPIKTCYKIVEDSKRKNELFLVTLLDKDKRTKVKYIKKNIKKLTSMNRYLQAYAYDNKCPMEINTPIGILKSIKISYVAVFKLLKRDPLFVQNTLKHVDELYKDFIVDISEIVEINERNKETEFVK